MEVLVYKRHSEDCRHKDDRYYRRCECPVWLQTNRGGKQKLWSAKTRVWAEGERQAQEFQQAYNGNGTAPTAAKTVAEAIELFLNKKRGENLAADSIYRHEHTTKLLQDFCNTNNIAFIRDVTLEHLTNWRASWTLKSPQARRSQQERINSFFQYCLKAGMIATNPVVGLGSVRVKNDATAVRPFEASQYKAILAAIDKAAMTEANKAKIRACMQLQRFAGLSLVDAVCLSKDELIRESDTFRVQLERRKTGSPINNPVPSWLGEELLAVKNGNPQYIFWNGTATPKGAVSSIDKLYRKVFKASGLTAKRKCGSHDFRHTFAVELLKAGKDVRLVSKALGHSSVTITERYYAKWCKHQQKLLDEAISDTWE